MLSTGLWVAGLLPLSVWALLTVVLWNGWSSDEGGGRLRLAMLVAAVLVAGWVVAGCEVLGLFSAVSFWPLVVWWAVPLAGLAGVAVSRRDRLRGLVGAGGCGEAQRGSWIVRVLLALTGGLVVVAGVVAALSPPNTFDALSYHMPRQVYWAQQQSVAHFAARDPNLTFFPPLAEFIGLHHMVLSGGDWYATLVQWFAFVMLAVAASLVARELRAGRMGEALAALLVVTNPMAWLQASSAKNDIVAALWVMVLVLWLVRVMRQGRWGWGDAVVVGLAAGLALLTKPTAVLFALPIGVVLGVWLLAKHRARAVPGCIVVVLLIASLNAGHLGRNTALYGRPMPSDIITYGGRPLTNEAHGPRAITSNIIKNVALHLGTPSERVNGVVEGMVVRLHEVIDWEVDDPRTSAYSAFAVEYGQRQEGTAAAPVHVVLVLFAAGAIPASLFAHRRRRLNAEEGETAWGAALVLLLVLATAFVLFCAMLKWQPWHARMHIGLLALGAPIIAVVVVAIRHWSFSASIAGLLLLPLVPTMGWNDARPLVGVGNFRQTSREEMLQRGIAMEGISQVAERVVSSGTDTVALALPRPYVLQRAILEAATRAGESITFVELEPSKTVWGRWPWPKPDLVIVSTLVTASPAEYPGMATTEDWAELLWWRATAENRRAAAEGRSPPHPRLPEDWRQMPQASRPVPERNRLRANVRAQVDRWKHEAAGQGAVELLGGEPYRHVQKTGVFRLLVPAE